MFFFRFRFRRAISSRRRVLLWFVRSMSTSQVIVLFCCFFLIFENEPTYEIQICFFKQMFLGAEVSELKGGVAGGSIVQGVLKLGDEIEVFFFDFCDSFNDFFQI